MTSDEHLIRCAFYCAREVIATRGRVGAPIPAWLRRHYDQLDAAVLSARGHENSCGQEEPDTLSTMETAEMVHRPQRWVHRHREMLSARKEGDRWRYPRAAVVEYAKGKQDDA